MDSVPDFEDLLSLFHGRQVRYLIIGGLAFIFHAKPRYTKDMDLWVEGSAENIGLANRALADFGSPSLLDLDRPDQVLQIGLPPNRIDILVHVEGVPFGQAWDQRISSTYGRSPANWIGAEALLAIKSLIDQPRHQEDARVLREVLKTKAK